jgi:hypothetical protein
VVVVAFCLLCTERNARQQGYTLQTLGGNILRQENGRIKSNTRETVHATWCKDNGCSLATHIWPAVVGWAGCLAVRRPCLCWLLGQWALIDRSNHTSPRRHDAVTTRSMLDESGRAQSCRNKIKSPASPLSDSCFPAICHDQVKVVIDLTMDR